MSKIDVIFAAINEILDARAKAEPLYWYREGNEIRIDHDSYATDSGIADCTSQVVSAHEYLGHANLDFIALSANRISALASSLEICAEALEEILKEVGTSSRSNKIASGALAKIAEILEDRK